MYALPDGLVRVVNKVRIFKKGQTPICSCCAIVGNFAWLESTSLCVEGGKSSADGQKFATAAAAGDAVVMVNGTLVNINSVLQNWRKSEEERALLDNELKKLEQECGEQCTCRCWHFHC